MKNTTCTRLFTLITLIYFTLPIWAEERNFDDVKIKTIKVAEGIYMLEGAGGNIGVSSGKDGVFLVDDQYSPLTNKILTALKEISDQPVKFLINTHVHPDHTGGNENLGKQGVIIAAHDNVYKRMNSNQFIKPFDSRIPKAPAIALPVITFNDQMTFHLNGINIKASYHANAHTDGDTVIHFVEDDVFFMGDLYYSHFYPFVDLDSGGSIYGIIKATQEIIKIADDDSIIVPGHGSIGTKSDLITYHKMLLSITDTLEPLIKKGMSLKEIRSLNPIKAVMDKWGKGHLKPDLFLQIIYHDISEHGKQIK